VLQTTYTRTLLTDILLMFVHICIRAYMLIFMHSCIVTCIDTHVQMRLADLVDKHMCRCGWQTLSTTHVQMRLADLVDTHLCRCGWQTLSTHTCPDVTGRPCRHTRADAAARPCIMTRSIVTLGFCHTVRYCRYRNSVSDRSFFPTLQYYR
jgi:hypothetical protein